jgi:hypothetical protein
VWWPRVLLDQFPLLTKRAGWAAMGVAVWPMWNRADGRAGRAGPRAGAADRAGSTLLIVITQPDKDLAQLRER